MRDGRLLVHQARYEVRAFWRGPTAAFFTLALPLIFLVLFLAIFGNQTLESGIETSTYYGPGITSSPW